MSKGRMAQITLTYNGANITADLSPHLINFRYVDNADDKADDLQINLQDSNGLWSGAWFMEKGAILTASIVDAFTGQELPCGTFEVDDVSVQGRPRTVTVKASSAPVAATGGALRRQVNVRMWEHTTLQAIASEMASAAGLEFYYKAPTVNYARTDQYQESNLAFLRRKAGDRGYGVKVTDKTLVIYSEAEREESPPQTFIDASTSRVTGWRLRTKAHDVYSSCRVRYRDPEGNKDREFTYTPDNDPGTGQMLEINERVESIDDARELAKSKLREKNKAEVSGTVSLVGNVLAQSGTVASLTSFGALDGDYLIKQATHEYSVNSGYTTEIKVQQKLGY